MCKSGVELQDDFIFASLEQACSNSGMKHACRRFLPLLFLILWQSPFLHADHYYVVPLSEIGYTDNNIDGFTYSIPRIARDQEQAVRYPKIQLENGQTEAYIAFPENENTREWWGRENQGHLLVAFKLADNQPVSGKAQLAQSGTPPLKAYNFRFDPAQAEVSRMEDFKAVRQSYYARLAHSTIPGGDWFRYQAGDAYKTDERAQRWRNLGEFNSSFNMFTGHRAVSENLALDRELIFGSAKYGAPVKIDSIQGVTVSPIDWSERITDTPTPIDPLAMVVPHDQHIAIFPSIKDLNTTIRAVEKEGVHSFDSLTNRKAYEGLAQKYQKQMGILIPEMLSEQLPVESVAITGGDPFLPSGSDLCLLFETKAPDALFAALKALITIQAEQSDATRASKNAGGAIHFTNADRSFSSILFAGEGYVAVANSEQQLKRLKAVASGNTPSLGGTVEYKFFKQRYPIAEESTAFIFLSDATIRRWAGPAFRIGASRRVRAAAVLGQASAQIINGAELEQTYSELVGELQQNDRTVRSEIFNTLNFLTPISELDLDKVTPAEKAGYERWRNGYENGWIRFDPIALSLSIDDQSVGLDLSVIPLRVGTRYNEWMRVAGDVTLDKVATTPHPESIFMLSYAIDSSSKSFQMANTQSSAMLPGIGANPLAWVAGSLSVFLDADPIWEEMHAAEDPEDFIEDNVGRLPVGLRVSSKSPVKLALFLTTLRSFSEQAAPGLLLWETREHEDTPYVVIQPTERAGLGDMDIELHYAALPDAFLLSLSEETLKRAIRRNQSESVSEEGKNHDKYQAFAQAKLSTLHSYLALFEDDILDRQQFVSWAALPILNEWHDKFPDQDPYDIHAGYFHEQIRCPGGQGYQWNADIGSMESVVFGHPLAPRGESQSIPLLNEWDEARAGLNLINSELRLKAELNR